MKKLILLFIPLFFLAQLLLAQKYYINENFNAASLPTGWSNTAVSGTQTWSFGIDGSLGTHSGNQNLDSTNFVFFDDDVLGQSANNNKVELTSPSFNTVGHSNIILEFDYNFREVAGVLDSFYVDVYDGAVWQRVFAKDTDDCGNYLTSGCFLGFPHAVIDISAYANANCKVRFTYKDGNAWGWYVGLDNVEVQSSYRNDIGVIEITRPRYGCSLSANDSVEVLIKNHGSLAVSNFQVGIDIDNGSQQLIEQVTTSIPAGDSLRFVFANTVNLSSFGNYLIKSFTSSTVEENTLNDSLIENALNAPNEVLNYLEDFENGFSGWTVSGNNPSWELGTPNNTRINAANSGNNSIVTNLTGNHNLNELSYLNSPCFDFSGATGEVVMSFDLYLDTKPGDAGLWAEYTIDRGLTWVKVKASLNAMNWYDTTLNSNWNDFSGGWLNVQNELTGLAGESEVRFRFVFNSGTSNAQEGVGIDRIVFRNKEIKDISTFSIVEPIVFPNCGETDSVRVVIEIKNQGVHPIDTFNAFYRIDNGTIISQLNIVPTNPVLPDSIYKHTLNQTFSITSSASRNLSVWATTTGDNHKGNDSLFMFLEFDGMMLPHTENFEEEFVNATNLSLVDTTANGWVEKSLGPKWAISKGNYLDWHETVEYDHTHQNAFGKYLHSENNNSFNTNPMILESPCFFVENANTFLSFWYSNSKSTNYVIVEVFDGQNWNSIGLLQNILRTSKFDEWEEFKVNLGSYVNTSIKIRIKGSANVRSTSFFIDDISIYEEIINDAKINRFYAEECYLDTVTSFEARIQNSGTQTISSNSLSISYRIDGGNVVTEIIPSSIIPGEPLDYKFNSSTYLPLDSLVSFDVWVSSTLDTNTFNDTLFNFQYSRDSISNRIDFEDETNLFPPLNHAPWVLKSGISILDSMSTHWSIVTDNRSPGGHSGSRSSSLGGKFIGLSSTQTPYVSSFITKTVHVADSGRTNMKFWYHKFGYEMGDLYIDVHDGNGWHLAVDQVLGQTHHTTISPWLEKVIDLTDIKFLGKKVKIRFRVIGTGVNGYMGVDYITFNSILGKDIFAKSIHEPSKNDCFGNNQPVLLKLVNSGHLPIDFTNDTVFITTNITGPINQTFTDTISNNSINGGNPLAFGDSILVNVASANFLTYGVYRINSTILMGEDFLSLNDTVSITIEVKPIMGGGVSVNDPERGDLVCFGDSILLEATDYVGNIQWQKFNGSFWTDIIGETQSNLKVMVSYSDSYRVLACSNLPSDTVLIISSPAALSIIGDSLTVNCGDTAKFQVTDISNGMNGYRWYSDQISSIPVYIGDTFKLKKQSNNINGSVLDSVFVEGVSGSPFEIVGPLDYKLGSNYGIGCCRPIMTTFNVLKPTKIISLDLYTLTSGDGHIIVQDTNTLVDVFDSLFIFNSAGKQTLILNLPLHVGNYRINIVRINQNFSSDGFFTNIISNYPYYSTDSSIVLLNTMAPIHVAFYGGLYNWRLGDECVSPREKVHLYADCIVGIEENNWDSNIKIFPNPTTGQLNIHFGNAQVNQVEIFNQIGQTVEQIQTIGKPQIQFDINGSDGIYFIKMTSDQGIKVKKIIKGY